MSNDLSKGGRDQQRDKAADVKNQAQQAAGQIKQQAQQTAGQVKDQVQQAAGQVKDQAQQAVGPAVTKVQEQVATKAEGQRENMAQSIGGVAQALRQTGDQMRGQDQMGLTSYIDQAADQVERLSGYLRDNDLGALVGDVERFARRQPALFLGGAFLAGLLGARFLRASRPAPRYDVDADYFGPEGVPGYGYQRNYGPATNYGTGATYGATNYGTGEIPGVYRSAEPSADETLARALGERLEG